MCKGVRAVVASATYVSADEADPEIQLRVADAALCRFITAEGSALAILPEVVLCVSAYGTAATFPFLETCAVEDVLADDG